MTSIDLGPERDLEMACEEGSRSIEDEVVELRNSQRELLRALQILFDLLEQYAPSWYTEEHHNQALAALRLHR
jgi:hypothetical protein